jgi:hypothetical protein
MDALKNKHHVIRLTAAREEEDQGLKQIWNWSAWYMLKVPSRKYR